MNTTKSQKAFTIVELIVVVAIIGLLTAITVANLATSKAKSRDSKRVSDIAQLQLALELFFDRCNQYPTADSTNAANTANPAMPSLSANNGCPTTPTQITLASFISKIPAPPTAGDYYYGVNNTGNPTDYMLHTKLENNNQILLDNVASAQYGATCSKTSPYFYCVQPK